MIDEHGKEDKNRGRPAKPPVSYPSPALGLAHRNTHRCLQVYVHTRRARRRKGDRAAVRGSGRGDGVTHIFGRIVPCVAARCPHAFTDGFTRALP